MGAFGKKTGRGETGERVDFQKIRNAIFRNHKVNSGEVAAGGGVVSKFGYLPDLFLHFKIER